MSYNLMLVFAMIYLGVGAGLFKLIKSGGLSISFKSAMVICAGWPVVIPTHAFAILVTKIRK